MSESTLIMRDISLQRRIRLQRYEFYLIYANKKCKFIEKDVFARKMSRILGITGRWLEDWSKSILRQSNRKRNNTAGWSQNPSC